VRNTQLWTIVMVGMVLTALIVARAPAEPTVVELKAAAVAEDEAADSEAAETADAEPSADEDSTVKADEDSQAEQPKKKAAKKRTAKRQAARAEGAKAESRKKRAATEEGEQKAVEEAMEAEAAEEETEAEDATAEETQDEPAEKDEKAAAKKSDAAKAKKKEAAKAEAKAATKKSSVAEISLVGTYPEGPTQPGLFSELQPSLDDMVRRIDTAASDEDVSALVLRIGSLYVGSGQVNELRDAIARVRKSGKPVYATFEMAESGQYLVAAAADEVLMPPSGMLLLPGVRMEMMFFKGLLDKVGVEYEVMQMGKYKGAGEPYSRTRMSPALRESLEAIADDRYENLLATLAADRELDKAQVKEILDHGLFTAEAAKEAGLVDELVYRDGIEKLIAGKLGVDEVQFVKNYGKKKVDADFSGVTGMMKFMQLVFGGEPKKAATVKKKIAVVYAVGPIMTGQSASSLFGGQVLGSTTLVEALREAEKDKNVVAIVLRIDSPGGSAVASDLIWREVTRIEKPIIASMGDVAGSGGYYIAMGADKILAEPGTITGSIGVISAKPAMGGLFEKIGITTDVISRGERAGLFSLTETMSPEDRKVMQELLEETYDQFVSKAAEGRKMDRDDLEALAQGRVYTGRMAAENGLIDGVGTLADAVIAAKKAAGLKADADVEIQTLPEPKTLFEQLFEEPSAASRTSLQGQLGNLSPELLDALLRAEVYRRLSSEPVLTLMPCDVELK